MQQNDITPPSPDRPDSADYLHGRRRALRRKPRLNETNRTLLALALVAALGYVVLLTF